MQWNRIPAGNNLPDDLNVVIEIPVGGEPVKYEANKETGALVVDRILSTSMRYPGNYGFVPNTLGDDGDPLDVLIVCDTPLLPGSVINCRAIGVLRMADEAGGDEKIIAVPCSHVSRLFDRIRSLDDLPELRLEQIAHFFENYKGLDSGKWVKLSGWGDHHEARALIVAAWNAASMSQTGGTAEAAAESPVAPGDARTLIHDLQVRLKTASPGLALAVPDASGEADPHSGDEWFFDDSGFNRHVA
jgi:inorganic pyrophosphatase